jgi:hypothetical protein
MFNNIQFHRIRHTRASNRLSIVPITTRMNVSQTRILDVAVSAALCSDIDENRNSSLDFQANHGDKI